MGATSPTTTSQMTTWQMTTSQMTTIPTMMSVRTIQTFVSTTTRQKTATGSTKIPRAVATYPGKEKGVRLLSRDMLGVRRLGLGQMNKSVYHYLIVEPAVYMLRQCPAHYNRFHRSGWVES